MKLLSPAISSLARMRFWRIEGWKNNPIDAQREVLQDLVTSAQYTEFGRKYNFSKLFSVKSYKQAVPIHEYDDIKPYIHRIMNGEDRKSTRLNSSHRTISYAVFCLKKKK